MTGVYDAYASKLGFDNVKLQIEADGQRELFAEYVEVEPSSEKAEKVLRTIRKEFGLEAYECICQAAASWDKRKANAILKTIVLGLHLPKKQTAAEVVPLQRLICDCYCSLCKVISKAEPYTCGRCR